MKYITRKIEVTCLEAIVFLPATEDRAPRVETATVCLPSAMVTHEMVQAEVTAEYDGDRSVKLVEFSPLYTREDHVRLPLDVFFKAAECTKSTIIDVMPDGEEAAQPEFAVPSEPESNSN